MFFSKVICDLFIFCFVFLGCNSSWFQKLQKFKFQTGKQAADRGSHKHLAAKRQIFFIKPMRSLYLKARRSLVLVGILALVLNG